MNNTQKGRNDLIHWKRELRKNIYQVNPDFQHSIQYYYTKRADSLSKQLYDFGGNVARKLEPLVNENDYRLNLPRLEKYSGIGEFTDEIVHHPNYIEAGKIIYGSGMMELANKPGNLLESLCYFFLSSHAGEAGHNCPIACTAGILRVFRNSPDFPQKKNYWKKLTDPNFETNYTGAQFVTEVQGGSDVGKNATKAIKATNSEWEIYGEKWFCSNADADLILITARYDEVISGTKGLGLFLVPAILENGERNKYSIRRLKEKIGTRTMASGEIDFEGAWAIPMGPVEEGFKSLMSNVLHLSRLYNSFATLGISYRAYQIAHSYSRFRHAFGNPIIHYPLIMESLAKIKAENTAMLAAIMHTTSLQDKYDSSNNSSSKDALLLRLLVNLNKYITAFWMVEHVHHAIESFSPLPRLLRDSIVLENWEGTHNTLRMQILRDMEKFQIHTTFLEHLKKKLGGIQDQPEITQLLKKKLNELKKEIIDLLESEINLKQLQIKDIVHDMILLYSAVQILKEGIHQKKRNNSDSKLNCLHLFLKLHLSQIITKNNYISLLEKIVKD